MITFVRTTIENAAVRWELPLAQRSSCPTGKALARIALVLVIAAPASGSVFGDVSDSHEVNVSLQPFSSISVRGSDVPLALAPREEQATVSSDAQGLGLLWMTNQEGQKITVVSSVTSPRVSLTVEAENVVGGAAVGLVLLDSTTQDFVVGVVRGIGCCDLRYTASAAGLLEPHEDVHIVSYTITDS
jgi:hypothetical protein